MVSSNEAGFNLREIVPLPRKYPVQAGDRGQLTLSGEFRHYASAAEGGQSTRRGQ